MALLLLLWGTACGRIDFDPIAAPGDAPAIDSEPGGLLLHFAFESDGLLRDRAPAHHDAVCATTCPVAVAGRVGTTAASFTSGACLEIADAPDLRPVAFTFALWFRPDITGLASAFSRAFNGATSGTNTFEAFMDAGDIWKVAVNTLSVNVSRDHGAWHHLAGSFDGNTISMYLDGAAAGTPRMIGPAMYGPDTVTIGCDVNNGLHSNSVTGVVDDVRLYDHALSASEIQLLASLL